MPRRGLLAAAAALAADAAVELVGLGMPGTGVDTLERALTLLGYRVLSNREPARNLTVAEAAARASEVEGPLLRIVADGNYTALTGFGLAPGHGDAKWVWQKYGVSAKAIIALPDGHVSFYRRGWDEVFITGRYMAEKYGDDWWHYSCGQDRPSGFLLNVALLPFLHDNCDICAYWHRPSQVFACFGTYHEWFKSVLELVPQEQRLLFNARDGWVPLCNFLGMEVPSVPFPALDRTSDELPPSFIRLFWIKRYLLLGLYLSLLASFVCLCAPRKCRRWRDRSD